MLLSIDLTRHEIIEVYIRSILATCARLSPVHIQLCLHLLLEPHDHVQAVTVEDLEDEHVIALVRLANCNSASQDALCVKMRLIDQVFNLSPLVLRRDSRSWLINFGKELRGLRGLLVQLEEK